MSLGCTRDVLSLKRLRIEVVNLRVPATARGLVSLQPLRLVWSPSIMSMQPCAHPRPGQEAPAHTRCLRQASYFAQHTRRACLSHGHGIDFGDKEQVPRDVIVHGEEERAVCADHRHGHDLRPSPRELLYRLSKSPRAGTSPGVSKAAGRATALRPRRARAPARAS